MTVLISEGGCFVKKKTLLDERSPQCFSTLENSLCAFSAEDYFVKILLPFVGVRRLNLECLSLSLPSAITMNVKRGIGRIRKILFGHDTAWRFFQFHLKRTPNPIMVLLRHALP